MLAARSIAPRAAASRTPRKRSGRASGLTFGAPGLMRRPTFESLPSRRPRHARYRFRSLRPPPGRALACREGRAGDGGPRRLVGARPRHHPGETAPVPARAAAANAVHRAGHRRPCARRARPAPSAALRQEVNPVARGDGNGDKRQGPQRPFRWRTATPRIARVGTRGNPRRSRVICAVWEDHRECQPPSSACSAPCWA